jgi:GNAT superfamily N-acetyltransferase
MILPVLVDNPTKREDICAEILGALPRWFGIPAARDAYIAEASSLPTFAVYEDGRPVGLLTLKVHNAWTAEIHVIGVLPARHRKGVGRALVEQAVRVSREERRTILTVKTLAEEHPDPYYAATRAFYRALEFRPLEVFPELWGAANPCLVMARVL